MTAKRKAAAPPTAHAASAGIVDHETHAVAELERQARGGWFGVLIRVCLWIAAAVAIEVLAAAYERLFEAE